MGLDALSEITQTPQKSKPEKGGKGPAELAKALGITEEKLKKMSPKDVEKLAKEKGVDLKEYGRPDGPPPPRNGSNLSMNEGILKFKNDMT